MVGWVPTSTGFPPTPRDSPESAAVPVTCLSGLVLHVCDKSAPGADQLICPCTPLAAPLWSGSCAPPALRFMLPMALVVATAWKAQLAPLKASWRSAIRAAPTEVPSHPRYGRHLISRGRGRDRRGPVSILGRYRITIHRRAYATLVRCSGRQCPFSRDQLDLAALARRVRGCGGLRLCRGRERSVRG